MPHVQIQKLGKRTKKGGESMTHQEIIDGCKSNDPHIRAHWAGKAADELLAVLAKARELWAEVDNMAHAWERCGEDAQKECRKRAAHELEIEIRDHIVDGNKLIALTPERLKALMAAWQIVGSDIKQLEGDEDMGVVHVRQSLEDVADTLREMLAGAEGK
jgi:hypothetical protein